MIIEWVGDLVDRHAGETFTVVGKGPTQYDYTRLADEPGPLILINEMQAVTPLGRVAYWFAHDSRFVDFVAETSATPVLPWNGTLGGGRPALSIDFARANEINRDGLVIAYEWGGFHGGRLRLLSRADVADHGRLHLHSGTIHSALHFAWLCGSRHVRFIGCEGTSGYDDRVDVSYRPSNAYPKIRREQDRMCRVLGITAEHP